MQTASETTYKVQRIGVIEQGIDGTDEYLLIKSDDAATADEVEHEFLNLYYRDTNHAGGYYCADVTVQQKNYSDHEFIVIVHHRYDV